MKCVYLFHARPPRSAKKARQIWDRVTEEDGAPPQWLGLYVSEGGFRDWGWLRANGEVDEQGAGLVGVPQRRAP